MTADFMTLVNSQNDLQAVKAKTAHLGGTQAIRGAQI
jgi:hypothetical protein